MPTPREAAIPASPHTFHIPVMGTGFTIDTPLRVSRYGIDSTVSLVDDVLIEQMRKYHCEQSGEPYEEIPKSSDDARSRRITAYLNLLDLLVRRQATALRADSFAETSDLSRYFEMLPDGPLRSEYLEMRATTDPAETKRRQERLRTQTVLGRIDVNIMTKLDREIYREGKVLPAEFADALSALRGFARSNLESSIVLSAGLNTRLYSYLAQFDDFFPTENAPSRKRVTLKVSDFRSSSIQGKLLAKRGIWISEHRIESGLNCGGHAFATDGELLGPILEEFRAKTAELAASLYPVYRTALGARGRPVPAEAPPVRVTVQGGIGTADEHAFLLTEYAVSSGGWGTPFLLVPEVTNLDDEHLEKLRVATEQDVYLSDSSPIGIPFWNLRTSSSEIARRTRIEEGRPGSDCPKGFLQFNTEFTDIPICTASRNYQTRKLKAIEHAGLAPDQAAAQRAYVLGKSCICHDLAGGVTVKLGLDPAATTSVCCGPNIVNYSRIATLRDMVDHIYGRLSLLTNPDRPHLFVREARIYVEFLRTELERISQGLRNRTPESFRGFREQMLAGLEYYRAIAHKFRDEQRSRILQQLQALREELERIPLGSPQAVPA